MNDRAYHYDEMDYKTFYNLVDDGDMIIWDNGDIDHISKDRISVRDKWVDVPGIIVLEEHGGEGMTGIPQDAKFEIYSKIFIHIVQWENTGAFVLYKKTEPFELVKDVNNE